MRVMENMPQIVTTEQLQHYILQKHVCSRYIRYIIVNTLHISGGGGDAAADDDNNNNDDNDDDNNNNNNNNNTDDYEDDDDNNKEG